MSNWQRHQDAVAKVFRMVNTGRRSAPADSPDAVDINVVVKHLNLEHAVKYGSSMFQPEAKRRKNVSRKWRKIQRHLFDNRKTNNEFYLLWDSGKTEEGMPNIMILLGELERLLYKVEVFREEEVEFSYGEFGLDFPYDPVISGYVQCIRYCEVNGKFPVLVWHIDKTSFKNDMCFLHLRDLRLWAVRQGYSFSWSEDRIYLRK